MARATGIQITGSMVRAVDIDGSPDKFKVRGFGEAQITRGGDDEYVALLAKAIKEALKNGKAQRDEVIVGIPVRDCIIREITVPFTDVEQIRKVIKFESEPHLHSCTIDEVVICFHKVAELGNRSTVMVIAVKKEKIQTILEALERCGIDPLAVDVDAAGLYALSGNLDQLADRKHFMILEIGYTSTMIMLVSDGNLRMVRSTRLGAESITNRVGKDLDLDPDAARTRTQQILKLDRDQKDDLIVRTDDMFSSKTETQKTSSELERDIIRQRQGELCARMEQEILRSLSTAKMAEPLDGVYLCGPGASLPRFAEDLAERLKVPVSSVDVLSQMDHRFTGEEVELVNSLVPVCSGLALKHIGADPLKFDFRQEEFVFAKKFDRLKVPLLCLVILMIVINGCWFLFESEMRKSRRDTYNQFGGRAGELFDGITNPKKVSADDKKIMGMDDNQLLAKNRMTQGLEGRDLIQKVGLTIADMKKELAARYSINDGSAMNAKDKKQFVSALRRWEQVFTAITNTGVKDFSINSVKATPSLVDFGITLPTSVTAPNGETWDIQKQLAEITSNLQKLPKEEGFVKLENAGNFVPRTDGRGYDIPRVTVEFQRENN